MDPPDEVSGMGNQFSDGHDADTVAEDPALRLHRVLAATRGAFVGVDEKLLVKWFAPRAVDILGMSEHDVGRSIASVGRRAGMPEIAAQISDAIAAREVREHKVRRSDGHILTERIVPDALTGGGAGSVLVFVDVTHHERVKERFRMVRAEMRHRLRNVLASVRALARRTVSDGPDDPRLSQFADAFEARVDALARTHSLLVEDENEQIELEDLIREEMVAHVVQEDSDFALAGPRVALSARAAPTLGLAVSELVTNALKFGAFAQPDGFVDITWRLEDGVCLILEWNERGVSQPPLSAPPGFGRDLIENGVPYDLGGRSELTFMPDGVRCTLTIPRAGNFTTEDVAPAAGRH
jgi:two-component system CheB/CheR fusion protein